MSKEFPPITIRLINRTETAWVLEGTENSENPQKRDAPGQYRIIPTSVRRISEGSVEYEQIRHIFGCSSILPEDQDKKGFKPDTQYDNIWITNGVATFRREGNMIGTYDFIRNYEGNVSNKLRPSEAEDVFEEVIASEIAAREAVETEIIMDAMDIVAALREYDASAGKHKFNKDEIINLSKLLNLDTDASEPEMYLALFYKAQSDPESIVAADGNKRKHVVLAVKKAEALGVLIMGSDKVHFASDNIVLIGYKGNMKPENKMNRLVDYLLKDPVGQGHYEMLRVKMEEAEKQALEEKS